MKNPTLTLGLVFRDHVQFKRAVIMYSLVNGYRENHFLRNEKLKVTWNHGCTKRKAYKALDRALKIIEGKHAEQYTKLWDFAKEVKKTNPGSTVKVKLDRDGNLSVINKKGFKKVLLNSHHRFCVKHLYINFINMFKGKTLNDALWSMVRTTTVPRFKKAMEDMKKLDEKAYNSLVKKPAHHWSKSYFETYIKCDMLLNNLCESFNVVILVQRQKPIVTMLLLIHILLMKRIQMKRDIMVNKVGDLYPKIKKKLEEAKIQSGRCIAQWLGGAKFQVDAGKGKQYVVDLVKKTCSCRKYGLTRIPCNHAIAVINFKKKKPKDYVNAYYSKARYLEVYSHLVMLMNGMSLWEETENPPILPPTYTRQPGSEEEKKQGSC
ncbi:unnamed protein product [Malus baccata var. baccata]